MVFHDVFFAIDLKSHLFLLAFLVSYLIDTRGSDKNIKTNFSPTKWICDKTSTLINPHGTDLCLFLFFSVVAALMMMLSNKSTETEDNIYFNKSVIFKVGRGASLAIVNNNIWNVNRTFIEKSSQTQQKQRRRNNWRCLWSRHDFFLLGKGHFYVQIPIFFVCVINFSLTLMEFFPKCTHFEMLSHSRAHPLLQTSVMVVIRFK